MAKVSPMTETAIYRNALLLQSLLLEYRLESVLGAGGFGMTYLGWDTNLEKHVAIKEYLPNDLALRALDGSLVPINTENEYNYQWGLERFIQEARILAKFSHPNIVRVSRFFEANGTGYMVMDYEAGESLRQYLKRNPMPEEAKLKNLLMPVLDGLQAVHEAGFLHRDIKPSNVFIRSNGVPVLLDFGSARVATGAITKSLTAIVTPGYAPIEQYSNRGNQGSWSDIYALAGVMYRAVNGENPPDSVSRIKADTVPHALTAARTRYSERFLKAIEWGMTIDEKLRPQNVAEWRDLFFGRLPLTAFNRSTVVTASAPTVGVPAGSAARRTTRVNAGGDRVARTAPVRGVTKWLVGGGIVLVVLALSAMIISKRHHEPASALLPRQSVPPPDPRNTDEPAIPPPAIPKAPAADDTPDAKNTAGDDTEIPLSLKREFAAADRDGDGYLSRAEVSGRFPAVSRNFEEVDTDGDGRISRAEFWQFRRKMAAGRMQRQ